MLRSGEAGPAASAGVGAVGKARSIGRMLYSKAMGFGCMAAAAAACGPVGDPAPSAAADNAVEARPARHDLPEEQRSPDLFGTWLVQAVATPDAAAQDRSWDMIMFVGLRQLEIVSQCVTIGPFDYGRTPGGGISVRQVPVPPPGAAPGRPTPPQCARSLSAAERALPPVLLGAADVGLAADGTVTMSGAGGTVTLRRPRGALRNPRGSAPPPPAPPPLGAWAFVSINGRALAADQNMELLLRPRALEWRSGCVGEARALSSAGDRLIPGAVDPFPTCERGRSEAEASAARLFAGALAFRIGLDGRMRLEGSGISAELRPLS